MLPNDPQRSKSIIFRMASNQVAANLLMCLLIVAGLYSMANIRHEIQPNYTYSSVLIDMTYAGAGPEEVEDSIILAVEAQLETIEGISKVTSYAREGHAQVRAEIAQGENLDRTLQSVKKRHR